jgi:hypothetical protein
VVPEEVRVARLEELAVTLASVARVVQHMELALQAIVSVLFKT